jgi:hypothetical protein
VGFDVVTAVVMKNSIFGDIMMCSLLKVSLCFGGTCRLHLQGQTISQARNQHESRWQAEISDYVGNRNEVEGSKSVSIGSLAGQNEPPVLIGCRTQLSKPVGDKNRITSMGSKRADFAGLGKESGEVVRV